MVCCHQTIVSSEQTIVCRQQTIDLEGLRLLLFEKVTDIAELGEGLNGAGYTILYGSE